MNTQRSRPRQASASASICPTPPSSSWSIPVSLSGPLDEFQDLIFFLSGALACYLWHSGYLLVRLEILLSRSCRSSLYIWATSGRMAAVAEDAAASNDRQFPHRRAPSSPTLPSDAKADYRSDVRKLVDLLSKLNPLAEEFVPSSKSAASGEAIKDGDRKPNGLLSADAPVFVASGSYGVEYAHLNGPGENGPGNNYRRKKNYYNSGRRRINERVFRAQREDNIRRTVYVSDIDGNVTEEQLAALFTNCGQVIDCRVCGDPHSALRFAFVEFADERCARAALNFDGTLLGYYPVRVLPSKTAILPVNPIFLPRSEDEREMCSRTVYCTNVDKMVTETDLEAFFEACCGKVSRLRLLRDHTHSTGIAFIEFVLAEGALNALNCSGVFLGALPIRVSPSKTPVRPRVPPAMMR